MSGYTYVLVCGMIPMPQGEEGSEGLSWVEWNTESENVMAGIINAMSRWIKSVIGKGQRTQRYKLFYSVYKGRRLN
jgi:hypothetical protein